MAAVAVLPVANTYSQDVIFWTTSEVYLRDLEAKDIHTVVTTDGGAHFF
jgi:hypothetical protein